MTNVTNIDDHRPHIVVNMGDVVNTIPLSLLENIAYGRVNLSDIDRPEILIRSLAITILEGDLFNGKH